MFIMYCIILTQSYSQELYEKKINLKILKTLQTVKYLYVFLATSLNCILDSMKHEKMIILTHSHENVAHKVFGFVCFKSLVALLRYNIYIIKPSSLSVYNSVIFNKCIWCVAITRIQSENIFVILKVSFISFVVNPHSHPQPPIVSDVLFIGVTLPFLYVTQSCTKTIHCI